MKYDNRFLKHNYSSRKSHSINEVILERWLMYNASRIIIESIMHVVTDLSSFYDRQLANIERIVLESTGVDRHAVKLFTKVIPIMNYYISSGYGIST